MLRGDVEQPEDQLVKPDRCAEARPVDPCPLIGVGGSASDPEAVRAMLASIPAGAGVGLIVLLQPCNDGHRVPLKRLSRNVGLKVVKAHDGQRPQAGHVYLVPSGHSATVEDGQLRLRPQTRKSRTSRSALDVLLCSMAQDQGRRTMAVILSGAGADGAAGVRAVKTAGGLVVAQDPAGASDASMPIAAIDTGDVDLVLAPELIGPALMSYASHPYWRGGARGQVEEVDRDRLGPVINAVREHARFDLSRYKPGTVGRRVLRRMSLIGAPTIDAYAERLTADPHELQRFRQDLSIGVTEYFRDPSAFGAFERQVVAPLAEQAGPGETIRVWVPACSTGEEAYSIAILFIEALEARRRGGGERPALQIFASDIDEEALARARTGVYAAGFLSNISAARRRRHFHRQADGRYQVSRELRDVVSFAVHDVLRDPPFSRLHVISCRNLMIYLEPEAQAELLERFHFALLSGGHLFLGASETPNQREGMFDVVDKKAKIFRRAGSSRAPGFSIGMSSAGRRLAASASAATEPRHDPPMAVLAKEMLLNTCVPASIVVNARHEVVYFHGPVQEYVDVPAGAPTFDLMKLLRDPYRTRVRAAVYRALRDGEPVIVADARGAHDGGMAVRVAARPTDIPNHSGRFVIVTFEPVPSHGDARAVVADPAEDSLVRQLEHELEATRADLRTTVDELESANERLKAQNEEILSINEELQSSNEELETSTEEMRSVNEELTTVNAQLKHNVAELERANNDLANFFASTKLATVFLDLELRVKRFTPEATKLLRLIPNDIGRPITDLASEFANDHLAEDAESVLANLAPVEREMRSRTGHWYLRRILPYRTQDNRIQGVVVTDTDVTRLREANEELHVRERQQAAVKDLGLSALSGTSLSDLLDEASRVVARTLGADFCKVLELLPEGNRFLLRAGYGWNEGLVGRAIVRGDHDSQAGYTLVTHGPVIVADLANETRFSGSGLLFDHGVVSGVSVIIHGRPGPFGVIGVHTRERREFSQHDVDFLQNVANVLSGAVQQRQAREALAASEARFREMADAAPVLIWMAGLDKGLAFFNKGWLDFTGRAPEQEVGFGWADGIHPEDLDRFQRTYAAAFDRHEPFEITHRLRRHDGEYRWILNRGVPTFDAHGAFSGYIGGCLDVTDRRRAEEELHEAHQRLNAMIQASPLAIMMLDTDGRVRLWNRAAERIFGWSADELLGRVLPTVPDDRHSEFLANMASTLAGEVITGREIVRRRKDGTTFDAELWTAPILNARGEPSAVLSVVSDITQRKRTAEEVRRAKETLEALIEATPLAITVTDPDGLVQLWNSAAEALFGWSRDEVVGRPAPTIPPQRRDEFAALQRRILEGRSHGGEETTHRGKDGTDIDVALWVSAVRDEAGRPESIVSIAADVRERKRAEDVVRAARTQLQFITDRMPAFVAHCDRHHRFVWVNRSYAEQFDRSADEMAGRPIEATIGAEAYRAVRPYIDQVLAGVPVDFETTQTVNGSQRWMRAVYTPVRDADGRINGFIAVTTDITARKHLEQAVRLSEERYRSLTESLTAIVWTTDADGQFVESQEAWESYTGQAWEQYRGSGWVEAVHPEDRSAVKGSWDQAWKTGRPYFARGRVWCAQRGEYRWFEARAVPLRHVNGTVREWIGTYLDVHDREVAEAALRESEERLALALQAGRMGAWEWDIQAGVVHWSETLEQIHGLEPGTFEGTFEAYQRDIHPDDRERVLGAIFEAVESRGMHQVQYRIIKPDGETAWLEARGRVVLDRQGKPVRMVGVCTDITRRRAAEEAVRRSEERWRSVFNQAAVGIAEVTPNGIVSEVNPRLCEILGFDRREIVGRSVNDFILPDDLESVERTMDDLLEGRIEQTRLEQRYRCKDGTCRWALVTASLVRGDAGQPERLVAIIQDITDRLDAEQALRESEERFRLALASGAVTVYEHDRDLRYTWVYPDTPYRPDVIDQTDEQLEPSAAGVERTALKRHVLETGQAARREVSAIVAGQQRWYDLLVEPRLNDRGEIVGVGGMALDITERKHSEGALSKTLRSVQLLSETASRLLLSEDPRQFLDDLFERLADELELELYLYYAPDDQIDGMTLAAWGGISDEVAQSIHQLRYGERICGDVARQGVPIVIENVQESRDPKTGHIRSMGVTAYVCHPLKARGRLMGTLSFGSKRANSFDPDALNLLRAVSDLVATAVERRHAQAALARATADAQRRALESEEGKRILDAMMDQIPIGITIAEAPDLRIRYMSRWARELLGHNADDGSPLDDSPPRWTLFHPDGREAAPDEYPLARAIHRGEIVSEDELFISARGGQRVPVLVTAAPIRNGAGQIVVGVGAWVDITERKHAEDHQRVLLAELSHRVKNTLATVVSIAAQTSRHAASLEQFVDTFEARLQAMSRVHGLLTKSSWEGTQLHDLLLITLEPYRDGRNVRLDGPGVLLSPKAAISLALVFHEMATNAAKYGALSTGEGVIKVHWSHSTGSDGNGELVIRWSESGGPPVKEPSRTGFGSRLLQHGVAYELDGEAEIDYRPGGIQYLVRIPWSTGGS